MEEKTKNEYGVKTSFLAGFHHLDRDRVSGNMNLLGSYLKTSGSM